MKRLSQSSFGFAVFFCYIFASLVAQAESRFTYQGRLENGGTIATGTYDFRFALYDAATAGNQIGVLIPIEDVAVVQGLFTVDLDFGQSSFTGAARWLEVAVRPAAETGDYQLLAPRQPLTATPHALLALAVAENAVTGAQIADASITSADLADGDGSGIDADLLDGLDSSAFKRRHKGAVIRWAVFDTCLNEAGWALDNRPELFGGIPPSTWSNNGGRASAMSSDKEQLTTLLNAKAYAGANAVVYIQQYMAYYSSNSGRHVVALFRIRNTTPNAIAWRPYFYYTAYSSWNESASVALNGTDIWYYTGNTPYPATATTVINLPANRTSTVIFAVGSSAPFVPSGTTGIMVRHVALAFYNNSLALPEGLEYVDDLDTATGGWEQ